MGRKEPGRGVRIETRRWTHRPARWLLPVGYAAAYAALFVLSSVYWFLPAGLRIAALWMLPRRDWWLLAIADMGAILAIGLYRDSFTMLSMLLAASVLPWCLYAGIVRVFGQLPGAAPTPESMMRFLQIGIGASSASALALTMVNAIDDGAWPAQPITTLFNFALGDFIGILLLAPLIRILLGQFRGHAVPWATVFANGLVFGPVALALGLMVLPVENIEFYPVVLSSLVLFWLAFRHGWRAGAIALLILSAGLYLVDDAVFHVWRPVQLQLLMAAAGFATLALGISADSLRTQGRALKASIEMLSTRTRALADTANRLVSQQEEERRRIGAELHDELGQDMTAIATRLRLIERATDAPHVREGLRSIESLVVTAHSHLREVIQSLHPLVLDRFGLARALSEGPMAELAREHGIVYECVIVGPVDDLPTDVASAIYRICQEVTTNCVRHGCGGRMRVHLSVHEHFTANDLTLRIDDDAGAFDIATGNAGLGLQNIYDRADAIAAEYTFDPESGHPRHLLEVRVKGRREESGG
jgi:two-component system, NarL family, sensor histidine kinase FusK